MLKLDYFTNKLFIEILHLPKKEIYLKRSGYSRIPSRFRFQRRLIGNEGTLVCCNLNKEVVLLCKDLGQSLKCT